MAGVIRTTEAIGASGSRPAGRAPLRVLLGAAQELVNGLVTFLPLPVIRGDVFVPQGDAAAGAAIVDSLLGALGIRRVAAASAAVVDAATGAQLRASRPLLASATVDVTAPGTVEQLEFAADAPDADWLVPGREATAVSVFVDGTYQSDVVVLHERAGDTYRVNLGALGAGHHTVELRAARELGAAGVHDAQVGALRIAPLAGDAALVARYQPVLQLRHLGAPDARLEATYTDTPLLLASNVLDLGDGSRRIDYYVMYSNEDGGTRMPQLVRETARGTDYEPLLSVVVDAAGNRVGTPRFQGPVHQRYDFDGQYVGDRPVLRVATANNNDSSRLQRGGSLWSEAVRVTDLHSLVPQAPAAAFTSLNNDATWLTDALLLRANPWAYAVMGKELLREARTVATRAGAGVSDVRELLFLGPVGASQVRRELEAGGALRLRLRDGSTVDVHLPSDPAAAVRNAAIPLPAGVAAGDVVGFVGSTGDVWVLDGHFQPRALAPVA